MKMLTLINALLCFISNFALAGSDSSGGGHVVVFKDDTVVLADPFIIRQGIEGTFHCKAGSRGDFSPELKEEIRYLGSLMTRYGAAILKDKRGYDYYNADRIEEGSSKFIEENVFRDVVEYCFVKTLPHGDFSANVSVLKDAEVHAVGYTESVVTWIQEDLFRRMNLLDQALLVIHERLHAISGNVPHGPILAITNGLRLVAELLRAQQHGERPELTAEQVSLITDFVRSIADLELSRGNLIYADDREVANNFIVWRRGGGLVHKRSVVDAMAYIGAASSIPDGAVVMGEADVINTPLLDLAKTHPNSRNREYVERGHKIVIGKKAFLKNSFFGFTANEQFVFVGHGSLVLNSSIVSMTFCDRRDYYTEKGALYQRGISIGDKVFVGKTTLKEFKAIFLRDRSSLSNVHIMSFGNPLNTTVPYATDLELREGASILNLKKSHFRPYKPGNNLLDVLSYAFTKWGDAMHRSFLAVPVETQLDFKNNYICYSNPLDPEAKKDKEWPRTSVDFIGEEEAKSPADLQRLCR